MGTASMGLTTLLNAKLSICWSDIVENFQMTEPKLPIK
jgi:hypothetical protein